MSRTRRLRYLVAAVAGVLVLGGLAGVAVGQGSSAGPRPSPAAAATGPAVASAGPIQVFDPVARVTIADASAMYFTLANGGADDALASVSCDGVGLATLHDTVVDGNSSSMKLLARLPLAPGGRVALTVGGLHVMLEQLSRPLVAGDTLTCELRFEKAGTVSLRVPVRNYGE